MKKKQKKANATQVEAKAQERVKKMVVVLGLEPSQYETAKAAIDYAVKEVIDPDSHEDAVLSTAIDFFSGYAHAKAEKDKHVYFMEIVEKIALSKGVKAALDYCKDLAEGGNADAAYFLAETYLKGNVCNQDYEKGAKYLCVAAKLGHVEALVRCGSFGYCSETTDEDEQTEIFDYFHQAALQGHAEAEMAISGFYQMGYGCKQNKKLAGMWGLKANIDKCDKKTLLSIMGCDE